MAITILQSPTQDIATANTDLLYVVESTISDEPNYQFVCDITDKDDTLIARIKQRPNVNQLGVFNLRDYIHTELEPSPLVFNTYDGGVFTTMFASGEGDIKAYKIKFGEEYSTDLASPSTLYNGQGGVAGDPIVSASVLDHTYFVDINIDRSFSEDETLDLNTYFTSSSVAGDVSVGLSDMPRNSIDIRVDDPAVVSFLNGPIHSGSSQHNDIYKTTFTYYPQKNQQGTTISTDEFFNAWGLAGQGNANGGFVSSPIGVAMRNALSYTDAKAITFDEIRDNFDDYTTTNFQHRLQYVQLGGVNHTIPATAQSYKVEVENQDGEYYDVFNFNIQEDNCPYPITRLMWQNSYGGWDMFNFSGKNTSTTKRTDKKYTQGFVDYSVSTTTNPYNQGRRGIRTYHSSQETTIGVFTDFLNQQTADWLEGLFVSPNVYVYQGGKMIPIVLETASYEKNTNPRDQKLKSYQVEFKYANPKRSF